MSNKLNKDDKVRLFDYLTEYENIYSKNYGSYNWNDVNLQNYFKCHGIVGKGNSQTKATKFFRFEAKKKNHQTNDTAHHFLRHVRNAIAHGNVKKLKGRYIEIVDYNNKVTMHGRVMIDELFDIINLIV